MNRRCLLSILAGSFFCLPCRSQQMIKTTSPCNDEILFTMAGRWVKKPLNDLGPANAMQREAITTRLDAIHQLMFSIYPEPRGVDPAWHNAIGYATFGEQVRYVRNNQDNLNREAIVEKPVLSFEYICGFFRYACNVSNPNLIIPGYPGETGTWIHVGANTFGAFATEIYRDGLEPDTLTVGGFPVHLRQPLKQSFDGYEVYYSKASTYPDYRNEIYVLLHRKGELPYIPVTRKQYLERCINHFEKTYTRWINQFEHLPIRSLEEQEIEKKQTLAQFEKDYANNPARLKSAVDDYLAEYKTDQEIRKEQVAKMINDKNSLIQRYKDELETSTNQGLLDSPAIVPLSFYDPMGVLPIFTEEDKGWMLVIENPRYMRRDLPKYVPQFFVIKWEWDEWKAQADIATLIENKFPFDKVWAMIDK